VPSESSPSQFRRAEIDPRSRQVGMTYAKALLGAAEKAGVADAVLAELDSLVADVLDRFPRWETVLASGLIPAEEKTAMLDRALGGQASTLLLNFLKVLAQHGRLDALRPIGQAAHELHDELRGRVPVEIQTATSLDDAQAARIAQALRKMVSLEPDLVRVTNSNLIGGLVIRVGDTVYDGSVSSLLERTRAQLMNRSVHEIQGRRDRFRLAGGD
jgi:F-type H+-transporting ATPase subunit delta